MAPAADGTPIAWRIDGPPQSTRAPLVLCNGIACDEAYWRGIIGSLVRERLVVRFAYRGHGQSGVPSDIDRTTMADVVGDLGVAVTASGVQRPVVIGHSFGVQVALEAVARLTFDWRGVVAIAGGAGHPLPPAAASTLPVADAVQRVLPRATDRLWHWLWATGRIYWLSRLVGGTTAETPPDVLRHYFTHVDGLDLATLARLFRTMQAHDATPIAATLDVPLLAIGGDADRLAPLPALRELALSAPDGELVVVRGAGHTLPSEKPEAVLAALMPFLARLDAA